jgi:hypothetical protein
MPSLLMRIYKRGERRRKYGKDRNYGIDERGIGKNPKRDAQEWQYPGPAHPEQRPTPHIGALEIAAFLQLY